jgi:hypothetical protein
MKPWKPRTNMLSGEMIAHLAISGNLESWAEMVAEVELQIAGIMSDDS